LLRIVYFRLAAVVECALNGAAKAYRERLRLASTQPGLGEGETVVLIRLTVGLHTQRETLCVTNRKWPPLGAIRYVAYGEVIEGKTQCTYKAIVAAPSAGKFDLVVGLFFNRPFDVNGTVCRIGYEVLADRFWIEVAELR